MRTMRTKRHYVGTKKAHVRTERGEIGYSIKRNILAKNEIITVQTLIIARYDRNKKMGIFQKPVFGGKGHTYILEKSWGGCSPPSPPGVAAPE